MNEFTPTKLWNRSYVTVMILNALNSLAAMMIIPLIPKFALSIGASLSVAGTVAGLMSISALVARPFSGLISDKFNKKWILVFSTLSLALIVFCYSISSSIQSVIAIRILHGIVFALNGTTFMAFAATFIPKERIGEGIGYLGIGIVVANSLGPSLGLLIYNLYGYEYCFWLSSLTSLVCGAIAVFLLPGAQSPDRQKKKITFSDFIAKEVLIFAFFICLFSCGNGIISSYIVLIAEQREIADIGLFFVVDSIIMFMIRPLAGKILDKIGLGFILPIAYIIFALAFATIGLSGSLALMLVAAVLKAVGQGSGHPSIQATSIKKLGVERSGVAVSTCFMGSDIGQGFGPVIGGVIAQKAGYGTMSFYFAGLLLLTMVVFLVYNKKKGKT